MLILKSAGSRMAQYRIPLLKFDYFDRIIRSRWLVGAIILAGLLIRLGWWAFSTQFAPTPPGEALNVARTLFETGAIADAFRVGQGPTAHLMPIPAAIAAYVYKIFGYENSLSSWVLTLWSLFLVFTSFWFFNLSFERMGSPVGSRVMALVILCLCPLNFALEVLWFRVWDGAMAVALASILLYVLVRFDGEILSWRLIAFINLMLAAMFFVQPNVGVGATACVCLFFWRTLRPHQWAGSLAIMVAAWFVVFSPWVIRNQLVMGSPILLRDNLGLEMALAFHDGAATSKNDRETFFLRHKAIHPYADGGGYAALQQAGGEVAYANDLKSQTLKWMAVHPRETVILGATHICQIFFPPSWFWNMFTESGNLNNFKMLMHWAISALGLISIMGILFAGNQRYYYAISLTILTSLPFFFVQPTVRYRYFIFSLLVFFACELTAKFCSRLSHLFRSSQCSNAN